jgi:hypothetical protein
MKTGDIIVELLDPTPAYGRPRAALPPPNVSLRELLSEDCLGLFEHRLELHCVRSAAGAKMIRADCRTCKRGTTYIKHADIAELLGLDVVDITPDRDNTCEWCRGSGCSLCVGEPCARCRRYVPTHRHHTAPVARFTDADYWPIVRLCQQCHSYWHSVMTPGMKHDPRPIAPHLQFEWNDRSRAITDLRKRCHFNDCDCADCVRDNATLDRFREKYGHQYDDYEQETT